MKFLNFLIFTAAFANSLVIKQCASGTSPPESKKLDIVLPKTQYDPILLRTNNVVQTVYSERGPVKVYSVTGEVLTSKSKRTAKSKIAETIPFVRKIQTNPPTHRYFQNYEIRPSYFDPNARKLAEVDSLPAEEKQEGEKESSIPADLANLPRRLDQNPQGNGDTFADLNVKVKDPIEVINLSNQTWPDQNPNSPINNPNLQKIFEHTEESRREHFLAIKTHREHMDIAYEHIMNIENQFRDAVNEAEIPNSTLMNAKVAKLLENFLDNLEYLEKARVTTEGMAPPLLYDYYLDKEVTLEELESVLNDEDALDSEISTEDVESLNFHATDVISKSPDLKSMKALSNNKSVQQKRALKYTPAEKDKLYRANRRMKDEHIQSADSQKYTNLTNIAEQALNPVWSLPYHNITYNHTLNIATFIGSLKAFHDYAMEELPSKIDLAAQNDQTLRSLLNSYHQINQFIVIYTSNIGFYEENLNVLLDYMNKIAAADHVLTFYGFDNQYDSWNCNSSAGCLKITKEVDDSLLKETNVFTDRINNVIIYINDLLYDIELIKSLIESLYLPARNQSLYDDGFPSTVDYSDGKISKILDMREEIKNHSSQCKEALVLIHDQWNQIKDIVQDGQKQINASKSFAEKNYLAAWVLILIAWLL